MNVWPSHKKTKTDGERVWNRQRHIQTKTEAERETLIQKLIDKDWESKRQRQTDREGKHLLKEGDRQKERQEVLGYCTGLQLS